LHDYLSVSIAGIPLDQVCVVGDNLRDWQVARGNELSFLAVLSGATTSEDFMRDGVSHKSIFGSLKEIKQMWERELGTALQLRARAAPQADADLDERAAC
jgi:ribonucleotide monophosphatase NagD (HAD superfamily)